MKKNRIDNEGTENDGESDGKNDLENDIENGVENNGGSAIQLKKSFDQLSCCSSLASSKPAEDTFCTTNTEDNLDVGSTDNEDLAVRLRKILHLQKKLSGDDRFERGIIEEYAEKNQETMSEGSTLEVRENAVA